MQHTKVMTLASFRGLIILSVILLFASGSMLFAQNQPAQAPGPSAQPSDNSNQVKTPEAQTSVETTTIGNDYIIGPEDVLRVDVFDVPDLTNLSLRVANDGTIAPPLLGHVKAAGLTPSELRRELETLWGQKYLQSPQVSVFVTEFRSMPVSVVGAVEKPGLFTLTGPRNLIEMISQAGGLAKRSSASTGRYIYITRRSGFADLTPVDGMRVVAPDKLEVNIQKLLYSNDSGLNIPIKPRDIISVSRADVVYVAGRGVQRPGGFVLEDRDTVTVFQAVAMAGGVTSNAKRRDALIIRTQTDGSRQEIPVDLDKVLKGQMRDQVLVANDILFVPDSAQKAALKHGTEMVIATISGLLIYGRI